MERIRSFQTVSGRLDFSHLGIRQSTPVKGSAHACETFCGSVCAGNPQKVSELRRPQPLPPTARRSSGDATERAPPGAPPEGQASIPRESSLFRSTANPLAKIGAGQGVGASSIRLPLSA